MSLEFEIMNVKIRNSRKIDAICFQYFNLKILLDPYTGKKAKIKIGA